MIVFIVLCEILFWVFLLSGLLARYVLKKQKLGMALLALSPAVDAALLVVTAIDLRDGGEATFAHALAAIYLGVSLVYGKRLVSWVDMRFAYRFACGPKPEKRPRAGIAHAAAERADWLRHLGACAIGCGIMAILAVLSAGVQAYEVFAKVAGTWGLILAIDFVISFSYTLFPRKEK